MPILLSISFSIVAGILGIYLYNFFEKRQRHSNALTLSLAYIYKVGKHNFTITKRADRSSLSHIPVFSRKTHMVWKKDLRLYEENQTRRKKGKKTIRRDYKILYKEIRDIELFERIQYYFPDSKYAYPPALDLHFLYMFRFPTSYFDTHLLTFFLEISKENRDPMGLRSPLYRMIELHEQLVNADVDVLYEPLIYRHLLLRYSLSEDLDEMLILHSGIIAEDIQKHLAHGCPYQIPPKQLSQCEEIYLQYAKSATQDLSSFRLNLF